MISLFQWWLVIGASMGISFLVLYWRIQTGYRVGYRISIWEHLKTCAIFFGMITFAWPMLVALGVGGIVLSVIENWRD